MKGGVAHCMCVKGRDSIIVQDVEERKPANQPANHIPRTQKKLMMLAIVKANEVFNYPPRDCVGLHPAPNKNLLMLRK